MIPDFDENGFLPPGIHDATFEEVLSQFSLPKSRLRSSRTQKLKSFYQFIRSHYVHIFVDGSYVTNKLAPNDVDLVVFLRQDFNYQSSAGRRLLQFLTNKKIFHLHIFHGRVGYQDEEQELWDYVNYFQKNTRFSPPISKGIIKVSKHPKIHKG